MRSFQTSDVNLSLPLVLKPNEEGSSVGISICHTEHDFDLACEQSLHGRAFLAEEFIEGHEITIGLLDGKPLPLIEIGPPSDLETYNFEAKYERDDTTYLIDPTLPTNDCIEQAKIIYDGTWSSRSCPN